MGRHDRLIFLFFLLSRVGRFAAFCCRHWQRETVSRQRYRISCATPSRKDYGLRRVTVGHAGGLLFH